MWHKRFSRSYDFPITACSSSHWGWWRGVFSRAVVRRYEHWVTLLDSPEESPENEVVLQSLSEKLAGIVLPDSEGRPVRLGSLWADQPAVIALLRHYGWIFCREHIAQLRDREQAFRDKGARLAAIGLGDAHYAQVFREETGITFPLLVDAERQTYRAAGLLNGSLFHIFRRDNSLPRKRARTAGHRQHKLGKNPFQLGGSFVFGPGNVDLYMHVSQTFGDNAPTADLLAAIP